MRKQTKLSTKKPMKIVGSITWPHVPLKMLTKMWPGYGLVGGQVIDPTFLTPEILKI